MKKLILLIMLTSCSEYKYNPREDISMYRCTGEQLIVVNKEFAICNMSNYSSNTCFKQAKTSQCTYIGPKVDKK